MQHLKEASGPSELVPSVRGQQSRIVITSEGHIEDEIQRISVSSFFANGNATLWSIPLDTLLECIYLFIYKDSFDPQPDFPTCKADKPEFTDEHYFASTVLKHFRYPQQTFLHRGGLKSLCLNKLSVFLG